MQPRWITKRENQLELLKKEIKELEELASEEQKTANYAKYQKELEARNSRRKFFEEYIELAKEYQQRKEVNNNA